MKNKEKYFDELIDLFFGEDQGTCSAFIKKHLNTTCDDYEECNSCNEKIKAWLEEEYVDTPRLSSDEYVILKNLVGMFSWIARDRDGYLYLHSHEPSKEKCCWKCKGLSIKAFIKADLPFINNFLFVKWEDEDPYNIQELLEEYESYHSDN